MDLDLAFDLIIAIVAGVLFAVVGQVVLEALK
jgi:hypothetical protein